MNTNSPIFPFEHKEILQTAMPMGGIGAGCVCLNGYGGIQDFAIRNRPNCSALPDGHYFTDAAFALLRVKGASTVTRLVEGPIPREKIYDQGLQPQGYRHGGHEGLPRFRTSSFRSGYPFGRVELSDPQVPVQISLTGWSPFIPLDDVASGIPCAILEYRLRNSSRKAVEIEFSYHLSHLANSGEESDGTRNTVMRGAGIYFSNVEPPMAESYGSASLSVIGHRPVIKAMWLRGGWFDAVSGLWREVEEGRFRRNDGREGGGKRGRNGGSVMVKAELAPGGEITIPVVIAWHFPNSNLSLGNPSAGKCCTEDVDCNVPTWRPFYTSQWEDAREVAEYVRRNYADLRERTVSFQRALLGSSFPIEVLDAVSANLAILKSPTLLRQENGNLWGWEGCFSNVGCCEGSCTHVWNYAQALPHLFPGLERTLREQELERSMNEEGHVNFRSALPDGPATHGYHAAADGQLGGIMKVYRDWHISGDTAWMERLYPLAKRSLDYCIQRWDPERKGALFEPHHNTYDIEFWGPDGMCTSIYIGALSALSAMGTALGNENDAREYGELARRAAHFIERELFNGEYFEQKVQFRGLRDSSFLELVKGGVGGGASRELSEPAEERGAKIPVWHGLFIGWSHRRMDGADVWSRSSAGGGEGSQEFALHPSLQFSAESFHSCQSATPRLCMGDEAGLLLCTWPRGGKPTLPFVYSDEVWTGIEYQVASHLIAEGFVDEGLQIVQAVRKRYDGRVRNPWNEYECGSYYARAMASYSLISALSGFRYSAVERTLWFGPKLDRRPFITFFSSAAGYGTISLSKRVLTVTVIEGKLQIRRIVLGSGEKAVDLSVDQTARPRRPATFQIPLMKARTRM